MTPRTLTEPEAWREIARRIVEGEWEEFGLCLETEKLEDENMVTGKTCAAMRIRVCDHVACCDSAIFGWAYSVGVEPEARALAALWLALEAEEESA
jgi:hypothetical protein